MKDLSSYFSVEQLRVIEQYLILLEKWNTTHNLVSKKHDHEKLLLEIIDAALGGQFLGGEFQIYDAGSGSGLPGVVLSIIYPQKNFILVESNRKKCSFLRTVKSQLNLANISIENTRLENLNNLNTVVSKAAFSPDNINILINALSPHGHLFLWATPKSGHRFVEKIAKHGARLTQSFFYYLPNQHERVILIFAKQEV